jgi:zinc transport system substrate-binding protein
MEILEDQVQEEEYVEGMQGEPEEETAYDEHVWLSLRNAQAACNAITKALCELDAEHGELYEQNCAQYTDRLKALDEAYAQAAEQAPVKTLLFGDRFPFRYLTEDYGLSYYAAFSGCSAETEASFHTITFMAEKVEELSLPAVLTIDGSDRKIAQAIVDNTESRSAQVLLLDSMQSVSEADIEAGENYLSIMERNLEVLKTALSENER